MTAGSVRSIWSYLELRGCIISRCHKEMVFVLDGFYSILCFSIKYKPPRAPGALKTASPCLTLYIGCYRTSLDKNFFPVEKSQNQLVKQCHISTEIYHFCHSISFFFVKYRRATASSFALQCPLDGSSNLARGYFF